MTNIDPKVEEEISFILATLPGKVFYAADGEALILADDGTYIISVEPPARDSSAAFNNGNPTTHSAYLYACPPEIENAELLTEPGWASGWEC